MLKYFTKLLLHGIVTYEIGMHLALIAHTFLYENLIFSEEYKIPIEEIRRRLLVHKSSAKYSKPIWNENIQLKLSFLKYRDCLKSLNMIYTKTLVVTKNNEHCITYEASLNLRDKLV